MSVEIDIHGKNSFVLDWQSTGLFSFPGEENFRLAVS